MLLGLNANALDDCLGGQQAWIFCGHADATVGGHGSLAFVRGGKIDTILASTIVGIVSHHTESLSLIILNGCHSFNLGQSADPHVKLALPCTPILPLVAPVTPPRGACCRTTSYGLTGAQLIDAGVNRVVCWDSLVADEAAVWFSLGFTRALTVADGARDDTRAAFNAAITSVLSVTEPGRLDNGVGGWGESTSGFNHVLLSCSSLLTHLSHPTILPKLKSRRTVQKFELGDPEAVVPRSHLMRGRREQKHGGRVVAGVPWLLQRLPSHRLVRVPHARGLAMHRTASERRLVGALHSIAYSVAGASTIARDRATIIALAGQVGVGKTSLAAWLARDVRAQALARDGVIWIDCGRDARADKIAEQLLHDIRDLTPGVAARGGAADDVAADVTFGAGPFDVLTDALRSRRCLVILDDVWSAAPLEPLLSTSLIVVFTTRNHALARACASGEHDNVITVPKLDNASATELLCSSAFPAHDAFTTNLRDAVALMPATKALMERCGGIPLVLVAAGNLVADCASTAPALTNDYACSGDVDAAERVAASAFLAAIEVLRAEGLVGLPALSDSSYAYPTIAASIEATLDELSSDARQRCEQLAVAEGGMVRITALREWWNVSLATGTSELRAWGLLLLVATPGAAATAAIQLSPLLRSLLLTRMSESDIARWHAELAAAEKLSAAKAEKLISNGRSVVGLGANRGDEAVCDGGRISHRLLSQCVRSHPASSLCVRRPAVRRLETVASILLALSLSLLFVVRCCPPPDLFVRVVRVSYDREVGNGGAGGESGDVEPGSGLEGIFAAVMADGPLESTDPTAEMPMGGLAERTSDESAPSASSAAPESSLGNTDAETWPSVLPTLDAGERYPDLSASLLGSTSWLQGAELLAPRRRRLSAANDLPGTSQPRFQLEWMPVWQMLATRDALALAVTERLAALDELSMHERFQIELSAQWGVYLPIHAEGRSVAKFHARWRPGGLVLFALEASALALCVDLCTRLTVHSVSRGRRRWVLGPLALMTAVLVSICAVNLSSTWLVGTVSWRASERVVAYASDGPEVVAGEYFVADYVGCAAPPFLGCGLWGGGSMDAFTLAMVLWMFALAPAALLALVLWARVYRRCHPDS